MKKLFVRSPYFIEVDESSQIEVKVELYLYYKGDTVSTVPTYTITERVPSLTQNKISINVANYAKDFIKPIAPVSVSEPTEEDVETWCYMQVISYSDNLEVNDETFVCLNGYTQYSDGYNFSTNNVVVPLVNPNITIQKTNNNLYVNVFYDAGTYEITGFPDLVVTEDSLYKIPLKTNLVYDDYFEYKSETICEPIYTPVICTFINRFGGWQYLTFFKANQQGIDVTSKNFNLMPSGVNYNVLQGQKRVFNFQGTQRIKCNTGWVNENYSELIQDLLLSEVVLLDNKPAKVRSQSFEIKTHLKDKNINYEIDFEFNYGLINDVI
jgi:hypothetical protein